MRALSKRKLSQRRRLVDDWSSDYDLVMRVLIADDHRLIVEGVKRALEEAPDFEVVALLSADSGTSVPA